MGVDDLAQPALERRGGTPIAKPDALDPFSDSADRAGHSDRSSSANPANQPATRGSARAPLRSSEMTLVSTR